MSGTSHNGAAVLTKAMNSLADAEAAVKAAEATIAPEREALSHMKAAVADAKATVEHAIADNRDVGRRGWFDAWLEQNDQTRVSLLVAAVFLLAAAGIAVLVPKHAPFQPGTGFLVFAGFYVVAQAIERLIELLALSPLPPNLDPDAETEAEKKAAEKRVTAQKTLVFAALSVLIAAGASVGFGLYFLNAVGVSAMTWLDVLVTALLISGGTKTLHDLIGRITATKEVEKARV